MGGEHDNRTYLSKRIVHLPYLFVKNIALATDDSLTARSNWVRKMPGRETQYHLWCAMLPSHHEPFSDAVLIRYYLMHGHSPQRSAV